MKTAEEQAWDLIESIERARAYMGITKRDFAKKAEMSEPNYHTMISGKYMPKITSMIRYANAAGLRLVLVPAKKGEQP